MTDAERPREISRRTITTVGAWSVPTIALAVMSPSVAASDLGTLAIATDGPTSGGNVTFWMVTVQNTSAFDISSGSLQVTVPKSQDYRFADNAQYPWTEADTGSSFTYTYNDRVFGGNSAPGFRLEFSRYPPGSTGTPIATISASAIGFNPATALLTIPF
ncbi:MAG: hypothetical protein Q7T71_02255 [Herbiconiux sp.]|nr:hypothetical protein [Herbiconiux sp.]